MSDLPQITQEMIDDDASDLKNDPTSMSKEKILKYIDQIKTMLKNPHCVRLRQRNEATFMTYMNQMFDKFSERYPALFKMVIVQGDNLNMGMLLFMLDKMDKIKSNEMTRFNASSEVGMKIFKEFVPKDILDKERMG